MFETKNSKILKSTPKDHQIPNKWTEHKILELKYGNANLLGNTKYNKVKFPFAVFTFLYQVSIKLYGASSIQVIGNITLYTFDFNKHLTIDKVVIARWFV